MTTDFLSLCWVELDIFSSLLSLGLDRKRTNGSMYQSLSPVGRIKSHRDRHYEFPLFSPFFLSFFFFQFLEEAMGLVRHSRHWVGEGQERRRERGGEITITHAQRREGKRHFLPVFSPFGGFSHLEART